MSGRTLLLGTLALVAIGCGGPVRPTIHVAVIGPRSQAVTLRVWVSLNDGAPVIQNLDIDDKAFVVDYAQGSRGEVIIEVDGLDSDGCARWAGLAKSRIEDDVASDMTVALGWIDPPHC